MKKLFLCAFLISSSLLFSQATEEGIQFDHSAWKEVLARAKKENKLVMLDAFTSWCGPCKWMAKNIFPTKEVGEFYNKNFVSAKIDMEKGEGLDIAKKYTVQNYPTFLFVDGDGKMVHRICGSREAGDFIQAGKDAMSADKNYMALEKNFKTAKSGDAALAYFGAAENACMDVEKDVITYLNGQKPASLTEKNNYQLIMSFVNDPKSAPFIYLLDHYDAFVAVNDKVEIDSKIKNVFSLSVKRAVAAKNDAQLAELQKAYRSQAKAPVAYLDAFANMVKAKVSKDTAMYFKAIIEFVDGYLMDDANQLNSYAWDFYEKTDNKTYLMRAEAWARRSIELGPAYYNYDTYAAVLYKIGKYTEAKNSAIKAIDLGKSGNEDVKGTEELLTKINEKLKV